ncbi:sigma-70 family RNA polymerase sigma factor [Marinilabiliaceae bacterium ANBcel2]|nr:sigma-70 family RNA polymerase sigma factor [Marinilabiliaceae bacterium ANBcel2]
MADLKKLSDEELVKSFVSGNQVSFNILLERHKQKVYSYIYLMIRRQELAEDILQDTFIKVHTTLLKGKYLESGKFVSWVMRISHNLIIDHFRRQKNYPILFNEDHERDIFNHSKFSDASVEESMVHEETLRDVAVLVNELPDNQREVVVLRHYLGLSFKEIADETNVSINTALGRMRYALINLRKMITENELTLYF